jgi:glutamyl-tRNA synthetase
VLEARYPGTCRGRYTSVADARERSGKEVGIRLAVEPGRILVPDLFASPQEFDVANAVGDFMIGRRDGTPAYQLAVVLDDAFDDISEIVRGDDLLPSAARQILLQRALDLETPDYFHVPLVVDEHGRRLAKREQAVSLASLRERGVDARAIIHWAARSAGLELGELVNARECLNAFDISKVPRNLVRLTRETYAELGL